MATPITVSSFNNEPISTRTNTTTPTPNLGESDSSAYSIEVTVLDYKSTASTPLKAGTPLKDNTKHISPGKYSMNSSPGKTNQFYQQLNIAVLDISTRLANLEDGIYSQLSRIEMHLKNLSSVSTSSGSDSTTDDLWSGLDPDFVAGNINDTCYFF